MRRVITRTPQSVEAWEWNHLVDAPETESDAFDRLLISVERERELWSACGAAAVQAYAHDHPGRRPLLWWGIAAPEPRRRLGGVGTPMFEVTAHARVFVRGVPVDWLTQDLVDCYRDHLNPPIRIPEPAYDPADPPVFESEPAYLERHGLLLPGERRRLKPKDFEPVLVAQK